MEPSVIFENERLIVLNKPAGWVVNDAKTAHANPIIQKWLQEKFIYPLSGSVDERSGVVHRLDKETSGLLLIAKTKDTFESLQSQFKLRQIKKSYTALVHGVVTEKTSKIDAPIGRLPWNRERFGVLPSGKEAQTNYEVIGTYKDDKNLYSLLKLTPKTGRTHQIRVHLKSIHHPVVGDQFYAGRKTARNDRLWCPRLFLHASSIEFSDLHGKKLLFSIELPDELKLALSKLEKTS